MHPNPSKGKIIGCNRASMQSHCGSFAERESPGIRSSLSRCILSHLCISSPNRGGFYQRSCQEPQGMSSIEDFPFSFSSDAECLSKLPENLTHIKVPDTHYPYYKNYPKFRHITPNYSLKYTIPEPIHVRKTDSRHFPPPKSKNYQIGLLFGINHPNQLNMKKLVFLLLLIPLIGRSQPKRMCLIYDHYRNGYVAACYYPDTVLSYLKIYTLSEYKEYPQLGITFNWSQATVWRRKKLAVKYINLYSKYLKTNCQLLLN